MSKFTIDAYGHLFEDRELIGDFLRPEQAARITALLEQGEADRRRLDLLESMRPCTLQMWVGQTAIHKPGEFFWVNEHGKTIREVLDGIAAQPASKEPA